MPSIRAEDGTELDPKVLTVMRAIRSVESGGDYGAVGDSGDSYGAFQYNEKTGPGWSNLARQYLGNANASMDKANQNKVTYLRIKQWKDEGKQPEEIAALWNGATKNADGTFVYKKPEYGVQFRQALDLEARNKQFASQGFSVSPAGLNSGEGVKPQEKKGFLGSVSEAVSKRSTQGGKAITDTAQGTITPAEGLLRGAGAAAGLFGDVLGAGFSAVTPDSVEAGIGAGVGKIAQNPQIQKSIQEFHEFEKTNPRAAENLKAFGNVASLIPIGKGAQVVTSGAKGAVGRTVATDPLKSVVADVAPVLGRKSGISSIAEQGAQKSFIRGLIEPKIPSKVRKIAETVVQHVPDFSRLKTYSDKLNAVRDANRRLGESLKNQVIQSGQNIVYPFKQLNARLAKIEKPIAIKADATLNRQFDLVREAALKIAKEKGGTIASLFDARKSFDDLVEKQFPTLYDRANAPMRDAITSIRREMNDFIEEQLPNVAFKNSLRTQTRLFDAIDNLAPKAFDEIGTTRLGRYFERHPMQGAIKDRAKDAAILGGLGLVGLGAYNQFIKD